MTPPSRRLADLTAALAHAGLHDLVTAAEGIAGEVADMEAALEETAQELRYGRLAAQAHSRALEGTNVVPLLRAWKGQEGRL